MKVNIMSVWGRSAQFDVSEILITERSVIAVHKTGKTSTLLVSGIATVDISIQEKNADVID